MQPQWPQQPQQPWWPKWPQQPHFTKELLEPDCWIIPGTKMTNTGPFLRNESSKIQFFTYIWYPFCWRLLRPTYIVFLKTISNSVKYPLIRIYLCCYLTYRKVASSIPVYYSIFYYFWGATNWDVLLTETCHYYHVQQSIRWWVQKRSHYLQIIHKYSHLP